jgi:hypothetical protein
MRREQPPWRPGRAVRVLRVDTLDSVLCVFLGRLQGHREHWTGTRTLPCYAPRRTCRWCGKYPPRFYAYAPVLFQDPRTGKADPWVLQVTASAEETLRDVQDLRGQVWLFSRPDQRLTAELSCEFVENRDRDSLPPPFEIVPVLERLFQVRDLEIPSSNPNPQRVIPGVFSVAPLRLAESAKEESLKEMPAEARAAKQKELDAKARKAGLK